jgi:hypothetical protein
VRKFLTFFLLALLPGAALAGTVGDTTWNIYAMGNGEALASILGSIKLLLAPDVGNSGFGTILLFMALIGFLVLAVKAGFDPGRNLGKMMGYILMVWMVMLTTTQIKADVRVYDPVSNYDSVVTGVPALVAVPASIISEIGAWMTRKLESTFIIPTELTMTAGATEGLGGGFNLFGRMMADGDKFVITNPDLKRSLSAYTADCVIPAISMGRLSLKADMLESLNMMESLGKAQHKSLLTKYYVDAESSSACKELAGPGARGGTLTCEYAYQCLVQDMGVHAEDMMAASSKAWETSGVMVPFETAMQSALTLASGAGGANPYAGHSRPSGYILQKSLISSMRGGFRQAAVQTGNNELLMSASIAQAEQAQRTGWWTAAEVFKNLTGYIYTTLQAFLFGIVPVIVIALMIPGLGAKIFVNYGQLLIWLALWMPLLAIVNYLIVLFGKQDLYSVWSLSGGPSMQTDWTVSEKTNNLVMAAQFLGTSVPILALGLVKGAMAFSEFVSHGIGSQFGIQAGATASSGNLSLGNMSMDNTSANKYNTAHSSAVGFQDVMAYGNAGSMLQTAGLGGVSLTKDGNALGVAGSSSRTVTTGANLANTSGSKLSGTSSQDVGSKQDTSKAISISDTEALQQSLSNTSGSSIDVKLSDGSTHRIDRGSMQSLLDAQSATGKIDAGLKSNSTVGPPAGGAGGKDKGGKPAAASSLKSTMAANAGTSIENSTNKTAAKQNTAGEVVAITSDESSGRSSNSGSQIALQAMHGKALSEVTGANLSAYAGKSTQLSDGVAIDQNAGTSRAAADAAAWTTSVPMGSAAGVAGLMSLANGGSTVDAQAQQVAAQVAARQDANNQQLQGYRDAVSEGTAAVNAQAAATQANHETEQRAIDGAEAGMGQPTDFSGAAAARSDANASWAAGTAATVDKGSETMAAIGKGVEAGNPANIQTVDGNWNASTSLLAAGVTYGNLIGFGAQTAGAVAAGGAAARAASGAPAAASAGGGAASKAMAVTKSLGAVGAAADAGMGLYDLANGHRQTEAPEGWGAISPMRWGMYAGEGINQGVERVTGDTIANHIYDAIHTPPPK